MGILTMRLKKFKLNKLKVLVNQKIVWVLVILYMELKEDMK